MSVSGVEDAYSAKKPSMRDSAAVKFKDIQYLFKESFVQIQSVKHNLLITDLSWNVASCLHGVRLAAFPSMVLFVQTERYWLCNLNKHWPKI